MAHQGYYNQQPPAGYYQQQPPPQGYYAAGPPPPGGYYQQHPQQPIAYTGQPIAYTGQPVGYAPSHQQPQPAPYGYAAQGGYQQLPPSGPPPPAGGRNGFWYAAPQSRTSVKNFRGVNEWQTSMLCAPFEQPLMCIGGYFFPWCCVYKQREKLLMGNMKNYECCQGLWGPSLTSHCNSCTEGNESFCLCLESFFCLGCAVHANRFMLMQHYNLQNDCCDVFVMYLSCFCSILACLLNNEHLENLANLIYYISIGCLLAQHEHQMEKCGYPLVVLPPMPAMM